MSHIDVFSCNGKYVVEPAYEVDLAKRINSPLIPKEAKFLFTLTKNDYVRVKLGEIGHEGYFVMYESDGRMTLRAHDQPKPDKDYFRKAITSAVSLEKFHVNVLGNKFLALPETRNGLA